MLFPVTVHELLNAIRVADQTKDYAPVISLLEKITANPRLHGVMVKVTALKKTDPYKELIACWNELYDQVAFSGEQILEDRPSNPLKNLARHKS